MQSEGAALPAFDRSRMMFIGISCIEDVFSSTNTASVLREQPARVRRFMASMPKGMAAFPSPSRLDATFSEAALIPGLSRPASGIRKHSSGLTDRQMRSTRPALSATRISPLQNIIPAATVSHSSSASAADDAAASAMLSALPANTEYRTPPEHSRARRISILPLRILLILLIIYKFLRASVFTA